MLIGTLNQALAAINAMNRKEVNDLTANIEEQCLVYCTDKRKKRDFCIRYIVSVWDNYRWDVIRMIYDAQED